VYVEPFFGSGAVLLGRPFEHRRRVEVVNDVDGLLTNVWRSLKLSPEKMAEHAVDPVHEADLHARHLWLVGKRESITERLMGDPDWHDPKAAGWWVWGASSWIGGLWCSGRGPWVSEDGRIVKRPGHEGPGVSRQIFSMGGSGRGVFSPERAPRLAVLFGALASRLSRVCVACGDWSRVVGPSATFKHLAVWKGGPVGWAGVFLDPPYAASVREAGLYAQDSSCSEDVRKWCIATQGERIRIVLAGMAGEGHEELEAHGWRCAPWYSGKKHLSGGYGKQSEKGTREHLERLWFSPSCLNPAPARVRLEDR
jgi:hypothetical protein